MRPRVLLAVLAHPDDEALGMGGALAKYAAQGVHVHLVTATRGDAGRYRGVRRDDPAHPGGERLGAMREAELRAAAAVLGLREVAILGHRDGQLDRVEPRTVIREIVAHVRRLRPDVVVTFGPDGAYGHPDHVAISQLTTAALVSAADPSFDPGGEAPHGVAKLYFMAWPETVWAAYQAAVGRLVSKVDGIERVAAPWPEWLVTTVVDTRAWWPVAWQAVCCHASQVDGYVGLKDLTPEHHEALWGRQSFYRAYSTVNGGRARETDLFEGLP
jgi:LmbE family N-acetylglucosaminyl deacetylase